MGDCRRPSWIVEKVSDLLLRLQFPEEMRTFRELEKDLNASASFEKKKELLCSLTNYLISNKLNDVSDLADLLSIRSRLELAPNFRKEFREVQTQQRDLIFKQLDLTAGDRAIYKSVKLQFRFAQLTQALGACLDNPEVQTRLTEYLSDCLLPTQCRQAIFNTFRGFRYHRLESTLVTELKSALRDSKSNWGEIKFLVEVTGSMLNNKIAGKYDDTSSPLIKFFEGVVDHLPTYQILSSKNQRFMILSCEMITDLPLEKNLTGDEMILGSLGRKLISKLKTLEPDLSVGKDFAIYLCNKLLENSLDLPKRSTRSVTFSIEGALWKINQQSSLSENN